MLQLRTSSLAVALAVALASCTRSQPPPSPPARSTGLAPGPAGAVVLGTFQGTVDPVAGKLTIAAVQAGAGAALPSALTVLQPTQDGTPTSGTADTFELVTETTPTPPGVVTLGCGSQDAFSGWITLRSFYKSQTFWNVYIELTYLWPSGYEACNSDATFADLRNKNGLWRYGTIGPAGSADPAAPDHVSKQWMFSYGGQPFGFSGRIMAMPGPEFDWTPVSLTTPTRRFQEVSTTTGHFLWDGTTFVDEMAKGVAFALHGTAKSTSIGLTTTPDSYADFSAGAYYVADAASASKIDTSGDFTVCARFKPGAHPGATSKVLIGKGQAESTAAGVQGWALMQMAQTYCFHYRSSTDTAANTMSYLEPGWDGVTVNPSDPSVWAFDYICGGRNSADPSVSGSPGIMVGAHGKWRGSNYVVSGTLTNDSGLPLAIGAYPDGTSPASDGGLFEVIFDSRPARPEVMAEIVSLAEGRTLSNGVLAAPSGTTATQTYLEPFWITTVVLGADANSYVLAPYATVPYAADASGLHPPGAVHVEYSRPFAEDTRLTGYCVGAELVADAGWWDSGTNTSPVNGGIVQFGSLPLGDASLGIHDSWGFGFWASSFGFASDDFDLYGSPPYGKWAALNAQAKHTFMACIDPNDAAIPYVTTFIDGVQNSQHAFNTTSGIYNTAFNAGDPGILIGIGNGFTGEYPPSPLTGVKISRVFFCPSNDPLLCQ